MLDEWIKEQLAKGHIWPSKSPWALPFFFVEKKDAKKLWPCQDYRYLNEFTKPNAYLLLLILDLMIKLKGSKCFTKLDIRWGYNNIHIKDGRPHLSQTKDYLSWQLCSLDYEIHQPHFKQWWMTTLGIWLTKDGSQYIRMTSLSMPRRRQTSRTEWKEYSHDLKNMIFTWNQQNASLNVQK